MCAVCAEISALTEHISAYTDLPSMLISEERTASAQQLLITFLVETDMLLLLLLQLQLGRLDVAASIVR